MKWNNWRKIRYLIFGLFFILTSPFLLMILLLQLIMLVLLKISIWLEIPEKIVAFLPRILFRKLMIYNNKLVNEENKKALARKRGNAEVLEKENV